MNTFWYTRIHFGLVKYRIQCSGTRSALIVTIVTLDIITKTMFSLQDSLDFATRIERMLKISMNLDPEAKPEVDEEEEEEPSEEETKEVEAEDEE